MSIETLVTARGLTPLPAAEEKLVSTWNRELFAPDRSVIEAFAWQDKRQLGFDIRSYYEGRLAGFAHVFARLGSIDGRPLLLGALGSVMTAAGLQNRGIGSATVTAAKRLIEQNLASDLGVLLCRQKLTPFYSRLGWKPAAAPVFIHQGENRTEWPHGCMLFAANAEIPPDPGLDLGGPPF